MTSFLYMFPVLAASKQAEIMYHIRHTLISQTPVMANIAMALAALFLIISMARTASRLMSDEQSAGLGGITLGQFIRPICMVALLSLYVYAVSFIDTVTNTVTTTITRDGGDILDDDLDRQLSEANSKIAAYNEQRKVNETFYAQMTRSNIYSGVNYRNPIDSAVVSKNMSKYGVKYDVETVINKLSAIQDAHNRVESALTDNSWSSIMRESEGVKGFTPKFCAWLFTFFYGVINAFAEIFLCILAIFGPFTLAFSVVEPWKMAPLSWLGKYIELSFWKVIAGLISWIVANSRKAISLLVSDNMISVLEEIGTQGEMKTPYVGGGAGWAAAIFSIAGLLCLFSISSITNAVLGMGGGEAMGGASGASNTIAKGMKDAPGKTAGGLLEAKKAGLL